MIEAIDDVFGVVAGEAEIEGVAIGVVFIPDLFALVLPALGDGVADEDEVVFGGGGFFVFCFLARFPPIFVVAVGGDDCGVGSVFDTGVGELFFHLC